MSAADTFIVVGLLVLVVVALGLWFWSAVTAPSQPQEAPAPAEVPADGAWQWVGVSSEETQPIGRGRVTYAEPRLARPYVGGRHAARDGA